MEILGVRGAVLSAAALIATFVTACAVTEVTTAPEGFPLNPCPVTGEGAVIPQAGYRLMLPGSIAFAYDQWHNETPASFACGAQSVRGADTMIRRSELASGILPWVATFDRTVQLKGPEAKPPVARLFFLEASGGERLVETIEPPPGPQYGVTLWNAFAGVTPIPLCTYRMDLVSAGGEIVAAGSFEIVE